MSSGQAVQPSTVPFSPSSSPPTPMQKFGSQVEWQSKLMNWEGGFNSYES
jgi:hypothetical protein